MNGPGKRAARVHAQEGQGMTDVGHRKDMFTGGAVHCAGVSGGIGGCGVVGLTW